MHPGLATTAPADDPTTPASRPASSFHIRTWWGPARMCSAARARHISLHTDLTEVRTQSPAPESWSALSPPCPLSAARQRRQPVAISGNHDGSVAISQTIMIATDCH